MRKYFEISYRKRRSSEKLKREREGWLKSFWEKKRTVWESWSLKIQWRNRKLQETQEKKAIKESCEGAAKKKKRKQRKRGLRKRNLTSAGYWLARKHAKAWKLCRESWKLLRSSFFLRQLPYPAGGSLKALLAAKVDYGLRSQLPLRPEPRPKAGFSENGPGAESGKCSQKKKLSKCEREESVSKCEEEKKRISSRETISMPLVAIALSLSLKENIKLWRRRNGGNIILKEEEENKWRNRRN